MNANTKIQCLIAFLSIALVSIAFGREAFLENVNVSNNMDPNHWVFEYTIGHIVDTLENHEIYTHYTSEEGYQNLYNMDMILLIHLWHALFPDTLLTTFSKVNRNGNPVIIWSMGETDDSSGSYNLARAYNNVLEYDSIETTMRITDSCDNYYYGYFFEFPPITNEVNTFQGSYGQNPVIIECGNNAYPFIFTDSLFAQSCAAIAYTFLDEENCSSYVMLITGTHNWKNYLATWELNDDRLATNMLLAGMREPGYELPPCAVPEPFEIEVDSVPECANPGDTIILTGRNLWQGSNENIGGDIEIYFFGPQDTVVIPFEYSDHRPDPHSLYGTWLKFVCPDLPEGEYDVELGHKAITFCAGKITIPCEAPYYLCSAAPNPFTPNGDGIHDEAKFEFPGLGEVPGTIKIFTLGNLRVRTIEVPTGSAAKQAAQWDGRDDSGTPMHQGIYIYTIHAEGRIICDGTVTLAR